MCNVQGINVSAKQKDVVHWHKNIGNLISIVTETKLKSKIHLWIADKFDGVCVFTFGVDSSYLSSGIAIIINIFLACYMCKISEISGWLLSVRLFFKNKLSVSILGLYANASSMVRFSQTGDINSIITKAVNKSFFVVLDGNFNENSSHKSTSFQKCLNLSLVNSLVGCLAVKKHTWENSKDIMKTINYHNVLKVNKHFNMNHQAIFVSVGLSGLLDTQLNSFCKQANRDCWKFDFKDADKDKCNNFKKSMSNNAAMFSVEFATANIIHKIMTLSAGKIFKKKWFKSFDEVFTKDSSRFHRLELLVSKIVKASCEENIDLMNTGVSFNHVCFALYKSYCTVKLTESLRANKVNIRSVINRKMESFEVNKSHMIRSMLECSFHKVVFGHLVVDDKLILEPDLVKSKIDVIMDGWTRKCRVYVFDEAFSGVISSINFDELVKVVSDLPDNKATGLSDSLEYALDALEFLSKGVLTNTHPIVLIKMTHKILSKILSDRISLACSTFNVLREDNFSVLKDIIIQSPIFAIGLTCRKHMIRLAESILRRVWSESKCAANLFDSLTELSSFFAAGTFIDDTIWINNISINNDKTVAILINSRVSTSFLSINSFLIFIAKKDIWFYTNLVLKKAILNKQLLYLVSAVFYSIVSYKMQFSFVPVGIYNKWNALICKGLKLKSGLPLNFPSDTIHHSSFYGLKFFLQVQSKSKIAFFVSFVNSGGVLSHLFFHRSHNLQVLYWCPLYLLSSSVHICVSASNNFLAGMICILLDCNLFLEGFLASFFQFCSEISMFAVLNKLKFLKFLLSFHWYSRLDFHGPASEWFKISITFFDGMAFSSAHLLVSSRVGSLNILNSGDYVVSGSLSVYMDKSLKDLGTVGCKAGAAAFFEDINLGLGIGVSGLMSSTMVEL
ncbi:hypothetical protein G9A89_023751 [Geosiphon pyriformis]|nr:hypothetical protein G9A89_023751 [Geosiphon pyriformis]